ncbi:uncharacterized protein LOC115630680 [Scaptodrosophila lebanonensis]|uniref:Uncharacterized protein LOC115630680 n=1 Tax=Drosophila lebanonensis TaxID=7225 RepID=A0A6J2U3H3_DROLE|nr:uncharacterized protein LOC115630680 [Scaptodrosophila lebanonensis]
MKYAVLLVLVVAACLVVPSAARGGRGRGGGSVGGLFGGWRKYKKPSSSGNGRRVMNGSPVHTAMPLPKPPPPPPAVKPMSASKPQMAGYPRQQLPSGYGYVPPGATGAGTYYTNAQSLPAGAIYYAQPPMRSGTGDFLTGMLAGHMMSGMLIGQRHHVTHVYHENQEAGSEQGHQPSNGRDIIVINNGKQQQLGEQSGAWPMATDVPLAPVNESMLSPSSEASEEDTSDVEVPNASQDLHSAEAMATPEVPTPAPGGIVCFPIMLNETDPDNSELVRQVERVICYPVPNQPPLPEVQCETHSYTETDPNDSSKTIEVQREECNPVQLSTTTTEPPIVAGEIGGGAAGEVASYVANRAGATY